jgi:hypothetical protein
MGVAGQERDRLGYPDGFIVAQRVGVGSQSQLIVR